MTTTTITLTRDGEDMEVEVTGRTQSAIPAGFFWPPAQAEDASAEVESATGPDGVEVELTEDERKAAEAALIAAAEDADEQWRTERALEAREGTE